jgi:predicted transcriptional regulator
MATQIEALVELYSTLYTFPREVGMPERRMVSSISDFLSFIQECTAKRRPCYAAVYAFEDHEFKTPIIDRIFLDFDSQGDSLYEVWDEVVEFTKFLESMKVKSMILFSGKKGFHIYIFIPPTVLKRPREALSELVKALVSKFEKAKDTKIKFLDWKVVGDVRRLARIPYTVHEETGRLAIIVDRLDYDLEDILEKSTRLEPVSITVHRNEELAFVLRYLDEVAEVKAARAESGSPKRDGIVYLQLPCIRTLLTTPLPPGKRRMEASKFIAIAYYYDHDGSMDGFETIAELFSERQKIGHQLKKSEVLGWKRGVYLLNEGRGPVWNCAEIRRYFRESFLNLKCSTCPLEKARVKDELQRRLEEIKTLKSSKGRDLLEEVKRVLDAYVVGEDENKLLLFLLLLEGQNVIVKGPPSTGKSRMVESVLKLFPEDDVVTVSGATKKFLRWMDRDYIPILYLKEMPKDMLEEVKGEGLAMDIKLAMSDKVLKIHVVDMSERRTVERTIRVDSVVMTTVDIDLAPDIESRVWILAPDISPEQTRRVLLYKALQYTGFTNPPTEDEIMEIREMVRALRTNAKIIIPGAQFIAEALFEYSQYPRVRRDIDKIFLLIGAVAKARGRIYNIDGTPVVIAHPDDVKTALELSRSAITAMVSNVDTFTYSIYKSLRKISETIPQLTPQTLADIMDIPQNLAEEYLEKLVKSGLAVRYREGHSVVYRLKEMQERAINVDFEKIKEEFERFMREMEGKLS